MRRFARQAMRASVTATERSFQPGGSPERAFGSPWRRVKSLKIPVTLRWPKRVASKPSGVGCSHALRVTSPHWRANWVRVGWATIRPSGFSRTEARSSGFQSVPWRRNTRRLADREGLLAKGVSDRVRPPPHPRRPPCPVPSRCEGRAHGVESNGANRTARQDPRERERRPWARHELGARALEKTRGNTASQRGTPPSARTRQARIACAPRPRSHPVGGRPPSRAPVRRAATDEARSWQGNSPSRIDAVSHRFGGCLAGQCTRFSPVPLASSKSRCPCRRVRQHTGRCTCLQAFPPHASGEMRRPDVVRIRPHNHGSIHP